MRLIVVTAAAVAAVVWAGVSAQQEMLPKPGPGSGLTHVIGAVNISNTPDVRVIEMPPLVVTSPAFVRKGGRYVITWTDGRGETVTVTEIGQDSWLQVENQRRRWINLRAARSVEETR